MIAMHHYHILIFSQNFNSISYYFEQCSQTWSLMIIPRKHLNPTPKIRIVISSSTHIDHIVSLSMLFIQELSNITNSVPIETLTTSSRKSHSHNPVSNVGQIKIIMSFNSSILSSSNNSPQPVEHSVLLFPI